MTVGAGFNGSNSEVRSNLGNDLSLTAFTFAAMVYNVAAASQRTICSFTNGVTPSLRVVFDSTNNVGAEFNGNNFPPWFGDVGSASWYLLAITHAGSTNVPKLYVTSNGSTWSTDGRAADAGTGENPASTISDIYIGDHVGSTFWNGDIATIIWAGVEASAATVHGLTDFNNWSSLTNIRFFTGTSLISAGTMVDSGSGGNNETSRANVSVGSQTIPSWFTNFGGAAAGQPLRSRQLWIPNMAGSRRP